MPRKIRIPSYRLHRASGQAVVTLSGHDHYLGTHGSEESRAGYNRLVAEWLANARQPLPDRAPDLTVAEALAAYWAHAQAYYVKGGEPTGQQDIVRRSLAPVRDLYGATAAARFGPLALQAARAWMVGQGLGRKSVNQRVGCVKRAFKWLAAQELVPPSAYHGLQAVEGLKRGRTEAPEHAPVGPAPEASVEAALPRLSAELADAARLQLLTACRPGEALALRACDLDRSGDVWVYRPRTHKTEHAGRERAVLIGPRAQALLSPRLEAAASPEDYLFSPRRSVAEWRARQRAERKSPVQPSQQDRSKARPKKRPGERYLTTSYARAVALACQRAGAEHWHPNQLRHNAATRLVAEFGWDVARILLGHSDLNTTRIYAENDLAKARDAARRVG